MAFSLFSGRLFYLLVVFLLYIHFTNPLQIHFANPLQIHFANRFNCFFRTKTIALFYIIPNCSIHYPREYKFNLYQLTIFTHVDINIILFIMILQTFTLLILGRYNLIPGLGRILDRFLEKFQDLR